MSEVQLLVDFHMLDWGYFTQAGKHCVGVVHFIVQFFYFWMWAYFGKGEVEYFIAVRLYYFPITFVL